MVHRDHGILCRYVYDPLSLEKHKSIQQAATGVGVGKRREEREG